MLPLTMDPLSQAMAPPPDETPEQRRSREYDEEQARYRSAQIDDEIKAEKNAMKKKKNPIKILVLGQSESGPFLLAEVKKRVVLINFCRLQENRRPLKVRCS